VVIRLPTGVELGDHAVQELSYEQQGGGWAQRRADCAVVHHHASRLVFRTTPHRKDMPTKQSGFLERPSVLKKASREPEQGLKPVSIPRFERYSLVK
jgi:hypothetical protein